MIPYNQLKLSARHAKVINGSLPTEKHGEEKKAFFDLKFEMLIEHGEIDAMLQTPGNKSPCSFLFDLHDDAYPLNMPDVDVQAKLRDDIRGDLTIKVGSTETPFEDAHTVGSVNRMTFMAGARGVLTMQFRVDPSADDFQELVQAVERGECVLTFSEYEDSAGKKKPENQGELSV